MAKLADLNDPVAVANAVSEFERIGRRAFLERYGFGSSRAYFVEAEGQLIDSEPLLAAIWARQFPTRAGLKPDDFSGGLDAGRELERLGLRVVRQGQYHLKSPVLFVWSSRSERGRLNLQHGLDTCTWGFKEFQPEFRERIEWVIFGSDHSGGSPRQQPADWEAGAVDLIICEAGVPYYPGQAPHWPDEVEGVLYPHRLGIKPVARLRAIRTRKSGLLGVGAEALRVAGSSNRGVLEWLDIESLLQAGGVVRAVGGSPDLAHGEGWSEGSSRAAARTHVRSSGAGRSADAAFNAAVERRAVDQAKDFYRTLGWADIEELGRPYDLVCRRPDGSEKHVEVKGTTGAGADVLLTPNEVHHFRTCPVGADLVVVRDIQVDRTLSPYKATGGELLYLENYEAPSHDLQATGWSARVGGWSALGV